jgi:hypothetical protein
LARADPVAAVSVLGVAVVTGFLVAGLAGGLLVVAALATEFGVDELSEPSSRVSVMKPPRSLRGQQGYDRASRHTLVPWRCLRNDDAEIAPIDHVQVRVFWTPDLPSSTSAMRTSGRKTASTTCIPLYPPGYGRFSGNKEAAHVR